MNFKDKRTRRICAHVRVRGRDRGGRCNGRSDIGLGRRDALHQPHGHHGHHPGPGLANQRRCALSGLADATYGVNVSTAVNGARNLVVESYTAPTGITYSATPHLFWAKQPTSTTTGRQPVGLAERGNTAATGSTASDTVFLTADLPGAYKVHFSDTMGTPGPTTTRRARRSPSTSRTSSRQTSPPDRRRATTGSPRSPRPPAWSRASGDGERRPHEPLDERLPRQFQREGRPRRRDRGRDRVQLHWDGPEQRELRPLDERDDEDRDLDLEGLHAELSGASGSVAGSARPSTCP